MMFYVWNYVNIYKYDYENVFILIMHGHSWTYKGAATLIQRSSDSVIALDIDIATFNFQQQLTIHCFIL